MTDQTIDHMEMECATLREENLKMKIKSLRKPEKILDDNKNVHYFTGLPSLKTLTAYEFVSPNSCSTLPAFQQFVMVLMKLRLNVDNQLLASIFDVHAPIILDRCTVYQTMPREFKVLMCMQ